MLKHGKNALYNQVHFSIYSFAFKITIHSAYGKQKTNEVWVVLSKHKNYKHLEKSAFFFKNRELTKIYFAII